MQLIKKMNKIPINYGITKSNETNFIKKKVNETTGLLVQLHFVLVAVTRNGCALKLAHDDFKADKEVVLVAVTQNGRALEFAHNSLKVDKEVVLVAVTENGCALEYAHDSLHLFSFHFVVNADIARSIYYIYIYILYNMHDQARDFTVFVKQILGDYFINKRVLDVGSGGY